MFHCNLFVIVNFSITVVLLQGGVLGFLLVSQLQGVVEEILVPLIVHAATTTAAGGTTSEEEVEYVDTLLHLFERYTVPYQHPHAAHNGSKHSSVSFIDACRGPIFAVLARTLSSNSTFTIANTSGSVSTSNVVKALSRLFREHKIDLNCPSRYLLDEIPSVLHHAVLAQGTTDTAALLRGPVHGALSNIAKLLQVQIAEPVDNPGSGGACMSVMTYHHVLLPIVWSLGGSTTSNATHGSTLYDHLCALQVLCTLHTQPAFRPVTVATDTADFDGVVSDKLQADFLYLMANLLLREWSAQSQGYQEQSLKCFNALIRLLKQSDLIKFLPKVCFVECCCL